MLTSLLSVIALASAASVASALPTHPFTNIVARQDASTNTTLPGGAVIPAACDSTCSSTLVIYGYCLEADNRCLEICDGQNYDAFIDCANCAFTSTSTPFTASQYVQLQATASTLVQTCASANKPVSPTKTFTPYAQLSSMWQQAASSTSAVSGASSAGSARPSASASVAGAAASSTPGSAGSRTTTLSAGFVGALVFVGAVLA